MVQRKSAGGNIQSAFENPGMATPNPFANGMQLEGPADAQLPPLSVDVVDRHRSKPHAGKNKYKMPSLQLLGRNRIALEGVSGRLDKSESP